MILVPLPRFSTTAPRVLLLPIFKVDAAKKLLPPARLTVMLLPEEPVPKLIAPGLVAPPLKVKFVMPDISSTDTGPCPLPFCPDHVAVPFVPAKSDPPPVIVTTVLLPAASLAPTDKFPLTVNAVPTGICTVWKLTSWLLKVRLEIVELDCTILFTTP